jgi:hypothetical protein
VSVIHETDQEPLLVHNRDAGELVLEQDLQHLPLGGVRGDGYGRLHDLLELHVPISPLVGRFLAAHLHLHGGH